MAAKKIAKRVRIIIDAEITEEQWRGIEEGARECKITAWQFFAEMLVDWLETCGDFSRDSITATVREREGTS